jgi:hypothetical protein
VGFGMDVILAAWGCLLAKAEGGFGPGWQFDCMGVPFSPR